MKNVHTIKRPLPREILFPQMRNFKINGNIQTHDCIFDIRNCRQQEQLSGFHHKDLRTLANYNNVYSFIRVFYRPRSFLAFVFVRSRQNIRFKTGQLMIILSKACILERQRSTIAHIYQYMPPPKNCIRTRPETMLN